MTTANDTDGGRPRGEADSEDAEQLPAEAWNDLYQRVVSAILAGDQDKPDESAGACADRVLRWTAAERDAAEKGAERMSREVAELTRERDEALRRVENLQKDWSESAMAGGLAAGYHAIAEFMRQRDEARLELAGVEGERDAADDSLDLIREAFGFKVDEVEGWMTLVLREIGRLRSGPPRLCDDCSINYLAWVGRPAAQEAGEPTARHVGTDPGHGGLTTHVGRPNHCPAPGCGAPLPGECMCGEQLDEDGDCPRCAPALEPRVARVCQKGDLPPVHADDCHGCEHIPGAVHCATEEVPEIANGGDGRG